MKTKPILFSTPMVQAILEGRKRQTRRIVSQNNSLYAVKFSTLNFMKAFVDDLKKVFPKSTANLSFAFDKKIHRLFSKIEAGDILWVRETWQHTKILGLNTEDENYGFVYRASKNGQDFQHNMENWKWKPSIFMPKEACRLFLEITNVRVERLQNIIEKDAIAEGIEEIHPAPFLIRWKNYLNPKQLLEEPTDSFKSLWQSINGKESWNQNPWVWVYDFKICEKPPLYF